MWGEIKVWWKVIKEVFDNKEIKVVDRSYLVKELVESLKINK